MIGLASVGEKSTKTALIVITLIGFMKLAGFLFTGGLVKVLFAEAIHSFLDAGNQGMIYYGIKASEKKPDSKFHYGYKQKRFVINFLSMFVLFLAGGVYNIYEGGKSFFHPAETSVISVVAIVIFILSFGMEYKSWWTAILEIRHEAKGSPFFQYLRANGDPTLIAIFLEDSAAMLGNAIGLVAVGLVYFTGAHTYDAIATIIVGVMLLAVSLLGLKINSDFLMDKAIPEGAQRRIQEIITAEVFVLSIEEFLSAVHSTDTWRIALRVYLNHGEITLHVKDTINLDPNETDLTKVCGVLTKTVLDCKDDLRDRIEKRIREEVPQVRYIDIEFR